MLSEILYMEQENSVATGHIYGRLTQMPSGTEILINTIFAFFSGGTMMPISSSTRRVLLAVSLL
jgi:hypothetical protein